MVLLDIIGYFKRNIKNMKPYEKKKMRKELAAIIDLLDKELNHV